MAVLERGFLNNAIGIKIDDWADQFKNLDSKNKSKLIEHYNNLGEDKKAEWIERSIKKNGGVRITLEDWSDDYPTHHAYADVIGTYPISKKDNIRWIKEFRHVYPKLNESFRCGLQFPSTKEARDAFDKLINGEKTILDYVTYFQQPEFADCL